MAFGLCVYPLAQFIYYGTDEVLDVAIDLCIRLREVYQKDIHNDLKGDGVLGHD